jgi:hypothetical protein
LQLKPFNNSIEIHTSGRNDISVAETDQSQCEYIESQTFYHFELRKMNIKNQNQNLFQNCFDREFEMQSGNTLIRLVSLCCLYIENIANR